MLLSFPTRERGLKCTSGSWANQVRVVVPHEGTWIEILDGETTAGAIMSFPTRERGLKLNNIISVVNGAIVVPHEGTWIEILSAHGKYRLHSVVPHEGTWIEIDVVCSTGICKRSFPTRERGLK